MGRLRLAWGPWRKVRRQLEDFERRYGASQSPRARMGTVLELLDSQIVEYTAQSMTGGLEPAEFKELGHLRVARFRVDQAIQLWDRCHAG